MFDCQDLEEQLRMALDDKTRFKMEADRHRDELNEKRRQCDTLEQVRLLVNKLL